MCQYQSKNMEVDIKIISFESFLNLTFFNRSVSALIQFKTFLRPLSQNCQNLRPFFGLKFVKINLRPFKDF